MHVARIVFSLRLFVLLVIASFVATSPALAQEGRGSALRAPGSTRGAETGRRVTDIKRQVAQDEAMRRAIESRLVRPTAYDSRQR